MTSTNPDFLRFSFSLFVDVLKRPSEVASRIVEIDTRRCLQFGWLCLFVSTASMALVDIFIATPFLDQISSDPARFAELTKMSGSIIPDSIVDFRNQLELFRLVSVVKLALSPFTAWFFPYLISGALFVLLNVVSFTKATPGTYDQVIKLVAVGQAPLIFCAIPLIGPAIGNIWCLFFVVKAIGTLFQVNFLLRLSTAALCFFFLFSIWNSTTAQMAMALQNRDWTWIK